ncbi:glycosyltransferase family 20-domain-containing protein [Suillus tomentosus]|nr:glycosyltransferase family 20-domain-containing protein [Suillus tomentosus]
MPSRRHPFLTRALPRGTTSIEYVCSHFLALGICSHSHPLGVVSHSLPFGVSSHTFPFSVSSHSFPFGVSNHSVPFGVSGHSLPLGLFSHSLPFGVSSHSFPFGVSSHSFPFGVFNHSLPLGVSSCFVCAILLCDFSHSLLLRASSHSLGNTLPLDVPTPPHTVLLATPPRSMCPATHGHFVDVGIFPMGIDVGALREWRREPDVSYWVQLLRQRYSGMMIVVGRDKLDEIQGVRHKLEAFELFLKKWPEYQGKVILLQVALQTTKSNELAAGGVSDVVARINSAFSTLTYQPVVFLHTQEVTFSQYLALLTVADAFFVMSLREGMALRTHEFVECQDGRHRPLILSEFTGSYSYSGFRSCIAVNPYDTHGTAKAIYQHPHPQPQPCQRPTSSYQDATAIWSRGSYSSS